MAKAEGSKGSAASSDKWIKKQDQNESKHS